MQNDTSVGETLISLVIKNPSAKQDFRLEHPLKSSIAALKSRLAQSYPDQPPPHIQKLIFAGRVLQDHDILCDVFTQRKCDLSVAQTLHLVLPAPIHATQTHREASQATTDAPREVHFGLRHRGPRDFVRPPEPAQHAEGGEVYAPRNVWERQNLGLIIKLAIVVYILCQGGSYWRTVILIGGALLIYLYQIRVLRFPRIIVVHTFQQQQQRDPQQSQQLQQRVRSGFLQEVENVIVPLIYSLSPTWQYNPPLTTPPQPPEHRQEQ